MSKKNTWRFYPDIGGFRGRIQAYRLGMAGEGSG